MSIKEIELPEYMSSLTQSLVDEITQVCDNHKRIISCGVNPNDNSLCFVTGDLDVRTIIPNGTMIPVFSKIEFDGSHVQIRFKDAKEDYRVSSETLILESQSCLQDAELLFSNSKLHMVTKDNTYEEK